jgi:Alpha-L-fucosidase
MEPRAGWRSMIASELVTSRAALPLWMAIATLLSAGVAADANNPNTDWLVKARYGVFMHFLPTGRTGPKLVAAFDVEALASQLADVGAGYFVLTLGQNSGWFNSPNQAYDRRTGYAPGERTSTRDLPAELSAALGRRGIRLMLYLPCQTPNEDARAQRAFGLPEGVKDQPIDGAFAVKWAEVIQEWADRYGDRVSGWWFDGGYQSVHFSEEMARTYARAVKHGNPAALVTFNPGIGLRHYTDAEDYTAGELQEPFDVIPESRWLNGSQWHALTYLGAHWGARDTRLPDTRWIDWARAVFARQGVITFDMGPNYERGSGPIGALSAAQVAQLRAIERAVR